MRQKVNIHSSHKADYV